MKADLYLKVILTIIAVCLVWYTLKPLFIPRDAIAYGDVTSVNIEQVGGQCVFGKAIPVKVVR